MQDLEIGKVYFTQDSCGSDRFWAIIQVSEVWTEKEAGSDKICALGYCLSSHLDYRIFKNKDIGYICIKSDSREFRDATSAEVIWLKACIKTGKKISKDKFLTHLINQIPSEQLEKYI
jgi:hypothetical protein